MRARIAFLLALLTLPCCQFAARGQDTAPRPIYPPVGKESLPPTPLGAAAPDSAPTRVYGEGGHTGLSDWITYRCRGCDSSGWNTPIQSEVYLRAGPNFPFGSHLLSEVLGVGWTIEGGVKTLFYNEPHTRAWYADLSLGNSYNYNKESAFTHPVTNGPTNPLFLHYYNRTWLGLGLGRQWYLRGDALHDDQPSWTVSIDCGGRYGNASVGFLANKHRSDVIGAVYAGVQSDIEIPLKCAPCVFVFGVRGEWDYTWSDILFGSQSDLQSSSVLFHTGFRY